MLRNKSSYFIACVILIFICCSFDIAILSAKINKSDNKIKNLKVTQESYKKSQKQNSSIKFDSIPFLQDVIYLAQNNNLEIIELIPDKNPNKESITTVSTQIQLTGSFEGFTNLCFQLEHLDYCTTTLVYKINNDHSALRINMQLSAYPNQNSVAFDVGKNRLEKLLNRPAKKISDPFNIFNADFSHNKIDILNWETKDLSIVGLITENKKSIAVIEDPLGYIYHLTVGDKIGKDKLHVIKITNQFVLTTNASQKISWKTKDSQAF